MNGKLVEYLVPHAGVGDGAELVRWDFDANVELAALADLNDGSGLAVGTDSGEEFCDEFYRTLGGGEADALRWRREASEELPGAEPVFAGDESVETFQRECEMGAAFVIGYSVDFIDDDCVDAAEVFPALAGSEEDVEGFRCSDENVGRVAEHRGALFRKSVSSADASSNLRAEIASQHGQVLDLSKRAVEVFLDIVGKSFERADVDDLRARGKLARERGAEKLVDANQKCGEGFAAASGGGDEGGVACDDAWPAMGLRFCGAAEFVEKPLGCDGMSPCQGGGDCDAFRSQGHAVF